jgi:hypothetical protein
MAPRLKAGAAAVVSPEGCVHWRRYGDITPMTELEIIVVMFCIVAGIVFFGVLLGSIAEALTVRGRA